MILPRFSTKSTRHFVLFFFKKVEKKFFSWKKNHEREEIFFSFFKKIFGPPPRRESRRISSRRALFRSVVSGVSSLPYLFLLSLFFPFLSLALKKKKKMMSMMMMTTIFHQCPFALSPQHTLHVSRFIPCEWWRSLFSSKAKRFRSLFFRPFIFLLYPCAFRCCRAVRYSYNYNTFQPITHSRCPRVDEERARERERK